MASSILTPTNVTSSDLAQTVQLSLASQHVGGVVLDNASGLMGGGGEGEGGGGGGGEGGGGVPVTISSEETIYSSGLAGGLGDNLLHVCVCVVCVVCMCMCAYVYMYVACVGRL